MKLLATLSLLLLLAAPNASAQEERKLGMADTATVVSVDPTGKSMTIRGEDGDERRIGLSATTRIQRGADRIPLGELEPGDRVAISARTQGATPTEQPIADVVQIVVEPGAKPGATPAPTGAAPDSLGGAPGIGAPGTSAETPAAGATGAEGQTPAVSASGTAGATAAGGEARATMRGVDGKEHGSLTLRDTQAGLLISASLTDLPPGVRGFHVHEVGRCEPPFTSAGEHLAPQGRSHGFLAPEGPHAGDLVNLHVGSDGTVERDLLAPELKLADLMDGDGAAFIVHQSADDYKSQPSGNAGDRIACAAVGGQQMAQ
jgi:superoxide dismutase, Cu-Zn family